MMARSLARLLAPLAALALLAGCAATQEARSQPVEIRVPAPRGRTAPVRARYVLLAADALPEPDLARTKDYVLRAKASLASTLLEAAAPRMRAFGLDPLEAREAGMASGRLIVVLTRLEAALEKNRWEAAAVLTVEAAGSDGKLRGRWTSSGRGAHDDSRILGGGAGLAMGQAIGEALDRVPWEQIGGARPSP
ncbi:MAG: hypothetical protein HYZ11_03065 [Candidatus Tectomicrobia bacterium]|uniref:Lipoprotein n=1 Tax=Tectimicrobiota bacterium TaxID=2528274 RepID=A0A932MNW0_UNCTE|nr:hypothetical protein [Candidatus Tectomicrobia bacterium]